VVDGVLVALAYYIAFRLRFEDGFHTVTNQRYGHLLDTSIYGVVAVTLIALATFGQYQRLSG
jgi:hypothetical protein